MFANVKWTALGMPLAFVALVVTIDCSNSTTLLCPEAQSQLHEGDACSSEGLVCPYTGGAFDQNRTETTSDCFGDFTELACTQKKWVMTAQASNAIGCQLGPTGLLLAETTACSPGLGRCVVPAGTVGCQTSCAVTGDSQYSYSATCVDGNFVVTHVSCSSSNLDAGALPDAATIEDASTDDAASSDAGGD